MLHTDTETAVTVRDLPSDSDSELQDVSILCIDCEQEFIWTVGEQTFFRDKGLQNPPKRCKNCKQAKNERLAKITAAQISGVRQKIEIQVNCAKCESETTVPFFPSQGRPVYCRTCFLKMNPHLVSEEKNADSNSVD